MMMLGGSTPTVAQCRGGPRAARQGCLERAGPARPRASSTGVCSGVHRCIPLMIPPVSPVVWQPILRHQGPAASSGSSVPRAPQDPKGPGAALGGRFVRDRPGCPARRPPRLVHGPSILCRAQGKERLVRPGLLTPSAGRDLTWRTQIVPFVSAAPPRGGGTAGRNPWHTVCCWCRSNGRVGYPAGPC